MHHGIIIMHMNTRRRTCLAAVTNLPAVALGAARPDDARRTALALQPRRTDVSLWALLAARPLGPGPSSILQRLLQMEFRCEGKRQDMYACAGQRGGQVQQPSAGNTEGTREQTASMTTDIFLSNLSFASAMAFLSICAAFTLINGILGYK